MEILDFKSNWKPRLKVEVELMLHILVVLILTKGEGSLAKQLGFKCTKTFSSGRLPNLKANQYSSGGGVAIKGTKFTGVF
jgi:hypothetical protein